MFRIYFIKFFFFFQKEEKITFKKVFHKPIDLNIDNMIETILDKDGFSCQTIFNFSERVASGYYKEGSTAIMDHSDIAMSAVQHVMMCNHHANLDFFLYRLPTHILGGVPVHIIGGVPIHIVGGFPGVL